MSVRTEFADALRTAWYGHAVLSNVRVIATEAALDDVKETTALVRFKSLTKAPSAPNSHRQVGLLLTLISGHQDLDRAGDELDEVVTAVLDYLDPQWMHDEATAVAYGDRLAFDIPVTVLAAKG